jgi:N-acetylglucosamine-6-phosphate deacetylase
VDRITAGAVVTPDAVLTPGTVSVEDGYVVDVTAGGDFAQPFTLVPGFIDVQVNGIGPIDVADATGTDWDDLDHRLLAQGVVAWCPTLVTSPLDDYAAPLARIASASMRCAILGAHLEGPFLGGAPGAHPVDLIRDFDPNWLEDLPDIVRLVTLAPELDDAVDAVRALAERDVVVSLGHSTATFEQAGAAIDAGATLVTHLFNGMGPLHHRAPGLLGRALTDDRVNVSLIADLVHVHPAAIALAFAAKPADRIVLVTDAVAWKGPVDDAPRLADGTLAGSQLTMDTAIANVVRAAGVPIEAAVRAASTTPADVMGEADRGRIAAGARADFAALDADFRCVATWIGGDLVYER